MPANSSETKYTLNDVYVFLKKSRDPVFWESYDTASGQATEEQVEAFEKEIGFRIPDEIRDFCLSPVGGFYMSVKEEFWPPAKAGDHGPFWTFLSGIKVFGLSDDAPEWINMQAQFEELQEAGAENLVPFFQIEGDSSYYCFDNTGRILHWQEDDPEDDVLDTTFAQLLMEQILELEDRRRHKLELLQSSAR
jgi:hypothetical protein